MRKGAAKFINSLVHMSPQARAVLKYGLAASCAMLTASLLILVCAGDFTRDTYELYRISRELYNLPAALLLISGISAACVESEINR